MNLLAIDLVLLPPIEMINVIIDLNNRIIEPTENNLILGTSINIPHVSIRMGLIEKDNLNSIIQQYKAISIPNKIETSATIKRKKGKNKFRFLLEINENQTLTDYHHEVMKIKGFVNTKAVPKHFHNSSSVKQNTLEYVTNFDQYAYDNFLPHITLGIGKNLPKFNSISFTPSLAVFQLGDHCTCSERLYYINKQS